MQVTEILTDHTLMALDLQGAEDYPIRFYLDIMDQFDRAGIHWHWHPALEFNVITKAPWSTSWRTSTTPSPPARAL